MRKQTAVEWLVSEIRNHIKEHGRLDAITVSELKMKAKAMEKKQIIEAYRYGESNNFYRTEISAQDYYTSTYE